MSRGVAEGSKLDARRRARDLDALADGPVLDVLVIGGGITGVGVALDAASRGLRVALVERRDLAAGTSRWSSKLIHGGLRYLGSGQIRVAAESTRERGILATRVAPHLIRSLPFLIPVGPAGVGPELAAAVFLGQRGAEGLRRWSGTPAAQFPAPKRLSAQESRRLVPGLVDSGLRSGLLHWDGQVEDDARLVITVARTAAALGAMIIPRCAAVDVGPGGARVVDMLTGSGLDVRARTVVNATGIWADQLDPSVPLRPSRGTHLVLPASAFGGPIAALGAPVPGHYGRVVFALPQPEGTVILGITDEPASEASYEPRAEQHEVDFLLDTFSGCLTRPLDRADILGVYSGLRPLLAGGGPESQATDNLSRQHAVIQHAGMITITGGKLTTYRQMAQDVVDLLSDRPCRTANLPLVGADPLPPAMAAALPRRLVRRFGSEAADVAALADGDPALMEPVCPGVPGLGVEVLWGLRAEGALSADDVLDGRLRLDLVPAWRDGAREAVSQLSASVLEGTSVV